MKFHVNSVCMKTCTVVASLALFTQSYVVFGDNTDTRRIKPAEAVNENLECVTEQPDAASVVEDQQNSAIEALGSRIQELEGQLVKLTDELKKLPEKKTYFSRQNDELSVVGEEWVDVPGSAIEFEVEETKASVELFALGSVTSFRPEENARRTYNHCGLRFVVSDLAYGDERWGESVIGCAANSTDLSGWWCNWTIRRDIEVEKGSHIAKLQMKSWEFDSGNSCTMYLEEFSGARFWLEVYE
ncbi:hypothetical protein OAM69_04225 [bacterium]|nr:hypothetical protein [bacterium]